MVVTFCTNAKPENMGQQNDLLVNALLTFQVIPRKVVLYIS